MLEKLSMLIIIIYLYTMQETTDKK